MQWKHPKRQCNRPPRTLRSGSPGGVPADLRERTGSVRIGYQQQSVGLPFLFQAASTGAYILGILFIFKRIGNFAISLPFYTSVATTHSSFSSEMTYTDWYFVSLAAGYTESGLCLSDASPPLTVGLLFSSAAGP